MCRLTRQHFVLFAAAIKDACIHDDDRQRIAHAFARICQNSNPRFNRDRFLSACGVDSAQADRAPAGESLSQRKTSIDLAD